MRSIGILLGVVVVFNGVWGFVIIVSLGNWCDVNAHGCHGDLYASSVWRLSDGVLARSTVVSFRSTGTARLVAYLL